MSASIAVGLSLALVLIAIGALFGVGAAYLWRTRRRQDPPAAAEDTVAVDGAMGMDALARLLLVLARMDPATTHEAVDDLIKDPGVRLVFLYAAIGALIATPGMPHRVRALADEMVTRRLWDLPTAERPSPPAGQV